MAAQSTSTAQGTGCCNTTQRAAAAPATKARPSSRPHPDAFRNPEIESIIADAVAAGRCAGVLVDVWREIGDKDKFQLRRLAETAPTEAGIAEIEKMLTRFLSGIDRVRQVIIAFKLAAREDSREASEGELYWTGLMESLEGMLPNDSRLDDALTNALTSLRLLNWGAALHAAKAPTRPAARAKQTKRAALATGQTA